MPRGCRDSKRMKEIGKATQFRGDNAAELGEKGNATKKAQASWRDMLKEMATPERMKKACESIFERAENGDIRAFEIIRDTMGEKPKDQVEIDGGDVKLSVNIKVIE